MTDPLEDVEKDAYHHSLLHFARNYYNEKHASGEEEHALGAKKQYHFLRSMLTSKLGKPIIDDNMNCVMCGKGIDDGENDKLSEFGK